MPTLSYSKLVEKKIKDKTELNHNIQWCPLINLLQSFIYNYDNIHSTINSGLQGLLSALGKPKSNPVEQVSFSSDKVNKNDTISEHDERWK